MLKIQKHKEQFLPFIADLLRAGVNMTTLSVTGMNNGLWGRQEGIFLSQCCRQPKPHVLDMQGKHSRASFAWHMSDFEDTDRRDSKWATLVRQSKSLTPRTSELSKLPKLPKKEKKRKH
ncbi:uncharacterized protein C4orf45 homolog isoform X2 [Cebus imitator]|uniref:uncharacterized protein C4orf45 homolog isoform X2 n=1 Tax=Cebus imitator TaxID=2715852 RepID=UPI00189A3CE7|nr:uncharacterized protein C4orf45 homolog isoform X2 [Cebus imitator]